MGQKILIIEDEKDLAKILGDYLEVEGFVPIVANDGEQGLTTFYKEQPGLILLDIMLPVKDGISVCKEIREKSDVPILMISAKSGEMDKVIALGIGADDYITKPFSPLELVARVKANLRRYGQILQKGNTMEDEIVIGDVVLKKTSYTAIVKGEALTLTTKEFEILFYLALHPNQVFTKEQIYNGVWGYSMYGDDNSVTVYIKRLREKLGVYQLDYIKTVWGVGYKLSVG
jgi:Response regulators consisting of a CheY-like receiver domain and a winged-helix DNA-binding domain